VRDEEGTMLQEATVEDVVVGSGKAGAANANDVETGTVAESAGPDDLNAGRQRQVGQRLASEESLVADVGDGVVKDDLGDVATMGKGLKAYIASGFSPSTGKTTMTRVFKVPAGEGLYLKGEPGSYDIPSVQVDDIYANLLKGVPVATVVNPTDGIYTNFILANDSEKGVGFYPLSKSGTIGPNKAYLQIPTAALPAGARVIRMVFEDEEDVTGIGASLNDKLKMRNDKAVYDLQGRRVANPTRGLYIKGGKKFINK